jgi:hypothetical protein
MKALASFKEERGAEALSRWARIDFGDRKIAMDALASMGAVAEKELEKYIFHADFSLRTTAQQALRDAGAKQEKWIDGAVKVLVDRTHPQRDIAVTFLSGYPAPPADRSKEIEKKIFDVIAERQPFNPSQEQLARAAEKWATKESADIAIDGALVVISDKTHPFRGHALNILKNFTSPPAGRSKEVCEKILLVVQERSFLISDNAANALNTWLTKESAPAVARAVAETDLNTNCEKLLNGLDAYKDMPGVAEAIAGRVLARDPFEAKTAARLTAGLAPAVVAKGMLAHLHSPDFSMRERARLFLSKAGVSTEDMVKQSIQDLASANREVRNSAVDFLIKTPVIPGLREDAAQALNGMIYEDDFFRRESVFKALTVWWNKDTVVVLCKAVNDPVNQQLRHKCIDAMSKLGEPAIAANIAYRLKFAEDRFHAGNALRSMGTPAEPHVAPYLLDPDKDVRHEAARIIEQIGTRASLPTVQKAYAAYNLADRSFGFTLDRVAKAISVR